MRLIDADKLKEEFLKYKPYAVDFLSLIDNAPTVEAVSDEHIKEAFETGYKMCEINLNKRTKGDRTERALSIIDRLRTDGHINNKEQGILRRTILLPEPPSDVK